MEYTQLTFNNLDPFQLEALQGLLGEQPEIIGIELDNKSIRAFCLNTAFDEVAINEICDILKVTYIREILPEKNWNESWEANFQPIAIDDFCYIKAHFHPAPLNPFEYVLEITPKMSFGTGHHATTRLVIQRMQQVDFREKSVFDFGTGTGILAILAEKLGAKSIIASDNDPWSLENAIENVHKNHCTHTVITGNDLTEITHNTTFDVIIANINRHILLQYMPHLAKALASQGTLLLSGFLTDDVLTLEAALQANRLQTTHISMHDNWVCIEAKHK